MGRSIWGVVWFCLYRPSPRVCQGWRRFLLRLFGAKIGKGTHPYPGAKIWAPWNLETGMTVGIADGANIYNPAPVFLDDYATVSQDAFLCTASHDYTKWRFPLITKPITVSKHAWIAARAVVNPGVVIGEGCVIGAGSVVTKDMPAWSVCGGNPCRVLKGYEKSSD